MRIDRTLPLKLLWAVYGVMWVGGVLRLHDTGWAAPVFLFVSGAIALVSDITHWRMLLSVGAIGFAFEAMGVRTGFPFGGYAYTGALQPEVAGVPLAIACAWMVLFAFARQFSGNVWVAAGLMTATDLLIDPVASGVLGYWRWLTPGFYFGVPILNFVGWYGVGVLLFALHRQRAEKNWAQRILGASILMFFAARAA